MTKASGTPARLEARYGSKWRQALSALTLGLVLLSGCDLSQVSPTISPLPSSLEPPIIDRAGVVVQTEVRESVRLEFDDGDVMELDATTYRQVTPHGWNGPLLVLGSDSAGAFVASFATQGGLPSDCYVENETGWNADSYVLIRGILWRKASTFAEAPGIGFAQSYAHGSRFCFNRDAEVSGVVAP